MLDRHFELAFSDYLGRVAAYGDTPSAYHSSVGSQFHTVEPTGGTETPPAPASRPRIFKVYSPNFAAPISSILRGRGRSITICSNKRPGRADMTITTSERNTAS